MWKRSMWVTALVAVMLLVAVLPVQAKRPDHRVNGWGEAPGGLFSDTVTVNVNARSFGDIYSGTGRVHLRTSLYRMTVDVDCLRVDNATGEAWMSGNISRTTGGWAVDHGVLVIVQDDPVLGDKLVGIVGNPVGGPWPSPVCNTDVFGTPIPFTRGDVRVR